MLKFLFIFLFITLTFNVFSQINKTNNNPIPKVYQIDIDDEINPAMFRRISKGFEIADNIKADLIALHINTYGGLVLSADSIRTRIMYSKIPVIAFIDNNAASAGALISIACDSIYMRKGSNMGAATVVNESQQAMPDKYQSYLRSIMRSTAESNGRNPLIAEAMVDPDVSIENIVEKGKVLTLTAQEALNIKYCEGICETIDDAIKLYGFQQYSIEKLQTDWFDSLMEFLMNPALQGILIILIIGGIWFEMQSPGLGFSSIVAIIAAAMYFSPLYLEGLAEHWEILLFVIGIVLLLLEIFVIPGFGITGISGIILVVAGLVLSLLANKRFNFEMVSVTDIGVASMQVVLSIFLAVIFSYFVTKKIFGSRKLKLALYSEIATESGYTSADKHTKSMLGKTGIAHTMLRPSGKVIIEDEIFDAIAETGFIDKGEKIKVTKYSNSQIFVDKTVS